VTGRPLDGRRIVVTRRPEQAALLLERLRDLGAEVVQAPTLDVVPAADTAPLDEALRDLAGFAWVVFTSANACRFVRERMDALGVAPVLPTRVGTVGPATSRAVLEHFPGGRVDMEPDGDYRAEGLLRAFEAHDVSGRRILLPVSDQARETLAAGLSGRGAVVAVVEAYRTIATGSAEGLRAELGRGVDLVLFASPSAVEGFVAALGGRASGQPAAVIGPVTEEAARRAGLDVRVVATPSTTEGLLASLARWASPS
jgi:uroporphyrinogen III methyltransferase/synthase